LAPANHAPAGAFLARSKAARGWYHRATQAISLIVCVQCGSIARSSLRSRQTFLGNVETPL
jgi:hypothetical protein